MTKAHTPLSERYLTTCQACGYDRQFFGTADEARRSALTMGWEFRNDPHVQIERPYCPHCKVLVPA